MHEHPTLLRPATFSLVLRDHSALGDYVCLSISLLVYLLQCLLTVRPYTFASH